MKLSTSAIALFLLIVSSFMVSPASAVIDFETTPGGGGSVDNGTLGLGDAYTDGSVTVTFGFDTDTSGTTETEADFEERNSQAVTDPPSGFTYLGSDDTTAAGFEGQLGDFFLRSPLGGTDFGMFVIEYTSGPLVTEASGEIWDIDGSGAGTEQFEVKAFDSGGVELDSLLSPEGTGTDTPLGGEPWVFGFSGLSAGISTITIDFVGTKTSAIGLAFNNFSATQNLAGGAVIPEPSSLAIFLVGLTTMFGIRRRRHRA